jgi:seryl-tRNA synthetase
LFFFEARQLSLEIDIANRMDELLTEIRRKVLQGQSADQELIDRCRSFIQSQKDAGQELLRQRDELTKKNEELEKQLKLAVQECDQICTVIRTVLED